MDDLDKKIEWLLLITPGLLALYIAVALGGRQEINEFAAVFYGFALSFLCYIVARFILWLAGLVMGSFGEIAHMVASVVVAVPLGVFIGVAADREFLYQAVRGFPLSDTLNRRSDKRPLDFILTQNSNGQLAVEGDGRRPQFKVTEAFIRLETENGTFEGWPEFWGDEQSFIYLSPACTISEDGSAELVAGPGVFVNEAKLEVATLLNRSESPCFLLWEEVSENASGGG